MLIRLFAAKKKKTCDANPSTTNLSFIFCSKRHTKSSSIARVWNRTHNNGWLGWYFPRLQFETNGGLLSQTDTSSVTNGVNLQNPSSWCFREKRAAHRSCFLREDVCVWKNHDAEKFEPIQMVRMCGIWSVGGRGGVMTSPPLIFFSCLHLAVVFSGMTGMSVRAVGSAVTRSCASTKWWVCCAKHSFRFHLPTSTIIHGVLSKTGQMLIMHNSRLRVAVIEAKGGHTRWRNRVSARRSTIFGWLHKIT